MVTLTPTRATSTPSLVILSEAKNPRISPGFGTLHPYPQMFDSTLTPGAPRPDSRTWVSHPPSRPAEQGFTLLELMIVMVVIGLLAAIAIPSYIRNIRAANEAVLKADLHTMRTAIDSYTVDKQKAPQSLEDLVQSGYLKFMPVDPMTKRSDTWMTVQEDTLMSLDQTESGINDVHSGAQQTALDGTSYNTW
jgi:general secretion pathway protein G